MTTPAGAHDRAGAARGDNAISRFLGFYGFARELPAETVASDLTGTGLTATERADRSASVGEPAAATVAFRPKTIGEPIVRAEEDDQLGASLWTTQPRICADAGSVGLLTVRAASVCGRSHSVRGGTREDAFAVRPVSSGAVVVAVADGVGDPAVRFSAVGAQVAAVLACRAVTVRLEKGQPVDAEETSAWVADAMRRNAGRFVAEPADGADLATTLIVAWVFPDGSFGGFKVGDGGVFELSDGYAAPVTPDERSFGGVTALPAGRPRARDRFAGQLARGSALIVATDGLADPMRSPDVAAVLAGAWSKPPSILGFLGDLSFERRGEGDDRTGVAVWFDARETTR